MTQEEEDTQKRRHEGGLEGDPKGEVKNRLHKVEGSEGEEAQGRGTGGSASGE